MHMKTALLFSLLLMTAVDAAAKAAPPPAPQGQWREKKGISVSSLVKDGFVITGTSATGWKEHGTMLVTTLQMKEQVFRCIDWVDENALPVDYRCDEAYYGTK